MTVIFPAIPGNLASAVTKFVAAFTGSAALLSEAIHSVVDTGNGGLMLFVIYKSLKQIIVVHFGWCATIKNDD